ncbi:MAG: GNAT family N-acetyltransferase [Gemmatimonadota bacterium]
MAARRSLAKRLTGLWDTTRTRGAQVVIRQLLRRVGIRAIPFYYVRELLPAEIPAALTTLPEGFLFEEFGENEVEVIASFREHGDEVSAPGLLDNLRRGNRCLGIRRGEEIVAFTWCALDASRSELYASVMQPNEAYLFNMYVKPSVRGHNIAAILRYKNYEVLRSLGRDTFYSITQASNKASWRFKQKLGAEKLLLGLYLSLFGRFEGRWILRRYPVRGT